ncbi:hypothetical protein Tco_0963778 [Tanacetum coccineum]
MSTLVFDPYEAIRQAYLVGTDTEFEPFKDPVKTEAPEIASVRVPPAMSPGLSASMAEVAAMSDSAFCTSELVEDDDKEEDDEEEMAESLDSDSVSEDAEDEGPTVEDKDPATGDEGLAAED